MTGTGGEMGEEGEGRVGRKGEAPEAYWVWRKLFPDDLLVLSTDILFMRSDPVLSHSVTLFSFTFIITPFFIMFLKC